MSTPRIERAADHGEVALTEVQDVRTRDPSKIGAIIDGQQRVMACAGISENLECRQLRPCLHALLPQLHDIDAGRQHRVQKFREVTLAFARVGAQVQQGAPQPRSPHQNASA